MTLDFYVRVLGMPLVHVCAHPCRRPTQRRRTVSERHPTRTSSTTSSTWAATACLRFSSIRKVCQKRIGIRSARCSMSPSSAAPAAMGNAEQLKANGVTIAAGPADNPRRHIRFISSILMGSGWNRMRPRRRREDMQVIRSCAMPEPELRAQLATISNDERGRRHQSRRRRASALDMSSLGRFARTAIP